MTDRLCTECRAEWWRWLDTTPLMLSRPLKIASNAVRDDTGVGIRENRSARWERWRDLVRFQQGLIVSQCARDHRVGQLGLFDVDVAA